MCEENSVIFFLLFMVQENRFWEVCKVTPSAHHLTPRLPGWSRRDPLCLGVFGEDRGWRFDEWLIMKALVPKLKL